MTERTTRVDRALNALDDKARDRVLEFLKDSENHTHSTVASIINTKLLLHYGIGNYEIVDRRNVFDWRKKYSALVEKEDGTAIEVIDPMLVMDEVEEEAKPKVLTLDIETAPNLAYVWGLFKENIPLARLVDTGKIITWSAKFMGDDQLFWSDDRDPEYMNQLADLINESDVLVHYNGLGFDMPWIRTEIVKASGQPLKPVREIDLLRTVRKQFRFTSNKLDHVAEQLLGENKVVHSGFELWVRVMQGDASAYEEMLTYNRGDVVLTEKLYKRIAQWIKNPVNMALITGNPDGCVYCGHTIPGNNTPTGTVYTRVQSYDSYRCGSCGAINRDNSKTSVPMRYRSVAG